MLDRNDIMANIQDIEKQKLEFDLRCEGALNLARHQLGQILQKENEARAAAQQVQQATPEDLRAGCEPAIAKCLDEDETRDVV